MHCSMKRRFSRTPENKSGAIIIVEDEELIALEARIILTGAGFDVVAAASTAEEALRLVYELTPDLVLMDIILGGDMDGVEAAAKIQSRSDIPVVYLTAYSDDETIQRALATKPYGYLIKPFKAHELITMVAVTLNKSRGDKKLREKQELARILLDTPFGAAALLDEQGCILAVNKEQTLLFGKEEQDLIGTSYFFHLPENAQATQENFFHQSVSSGDALTFEEVRCDRILQHRIYPIGNRPQTDLVAIFSLDVTTEKTAVRELRASQEQLRALTARIQSVREEERKHISREIHDNLGQSLTALKMETAWLAKRYAKIIGQESQDIIRDSFYRINGIIEDSMNTVRRIAMELRPGVLDDLGLVSAIEWQLQEFRERTGIPFHFATELDDDAVDTEIATELFRIFQEALTNVYRHAGAASVDVRLTASDGRLDMVIADDGRGIPPEKITTAESLGILGMKERAFLLRGEVVVSGEEGAGTTVSVRIPLGSEG
ncbi:MAG: response regulator [Deltaproteobacteria bacterium]|nr:response regulator [Deltaproteobacteria bacterium]